MIGLFISPQCKRGRARSRQRVGHDHPHALAPEAARGDHGLDRERHEDHAPYRPGVGAQRSRDEQEDPAGGQDGHKPHRRSAAEEAAGHGGWKKTGEAHACHPNGTGMTQPERGWKAKCACPRECPLCDEVGRERQRVRCKRDGQEGRREERSVQRAVWPREGDQRRRHRDGEVGCGERGERDALFGRLCGCGFLGCWLGLDVHENSLLLLLLLQL